MKPTKFYFLWWLYSGSNQPIGIAFTTNFPNSISTFVKCSQNQHDPIWYFTLLLTCQLFTRMRIAYHFAMCLKWDVVHICLVQSNLKCIVYQKSSLYSNYIGCCAYFIYNQKTKTIWGIGSSKCNLGRRESSMLSICLLHMTRKTNRRTEYITTSECNTSEQFIRRHSILTILSAACD